MTTAGYVRISDSKGSDVSPDRQRALIAAYCYRAKLELAHVYYDKDASGGDSDRREWQRLLTACRRGEVTSIVAYDQDRLFRDEEEAAKFLKFVKRHKIDVHFVATGQLDTRSAASQMMFSMKAVVDAHYRRVVSERTQTALDHKRQRGEKLGGHVPYGYDLDSEGKLQLNVDEQYTVALLLELRDAGLGVRSIATELTKRGIRTKTGLAYWAPSTVAKVLVSVERKVKVVG